MTAKLDIAFPTVAQIRKGGQKRVIQKNGRSIEAFGTDLEDKFRVVFAPGAQEIMTAFMEVYGTLTPTRIRAMIPFQSVWSTWYFANEAYASSCRVAQADDEHFISLRDPLTLAYTIRNGEPYRPYTPGEKISYQRDGKTYSLTIKPNGRLRLFLPEIGRWVTFELRTNAYYDRVNIEQQLGALQAIANVLNNGNAAGIPFNIYRRLGEVLWNKPDGGALRVKKWLVNIEIDPEWGAQALQKLTCSALGNLTPNSFDLAPSGPILSPVDPSQEDAGDEDENETEFPADVATEALDEGLSPPDADFLPDGEPAETPATSDSGDLVPDASKSKVGTVGDLAPANPKDWTTYWSITVPGLKVSQEQALEALRSADNDALAAYQALLKGGDN
jgi:hypothetical protein